MAGLLVHEWIADRGGSENVLEAMARAFPDADIHCLWNDDPERFRGRKVTESWLARTPLRRSKAAALPFMPATWSRTDVSGNDFVLVSSHLFAHHVGGRTRPGGPRKFVYVHTPARYIWAPELDSRGNNPVVRASAPMLKRLDAARASDGAVFAANSEFVRDRIRTAWGQDATVIHPPVRVELLQSVEDWRDRLNAADTKVFESLPEQFVLGASRFVPYKRLDLVIRAGESVDVPVVLAGSGPQRAELAAAAEGASVPVHIVDAPSDELLFALYQRALVFVFPAVEDFGIMPVEAMAVGTPVVVGGVGGARESVSALTGGEIVRGWRDEELSAALSRAAERNMSAAKQAASGAFGLAAFERRLRAWVTA